MQNATLFIWMFFYAAALARFASVLQAERYHTDAYLKWAAQGGAIRTFGKGVSDQWLHAAILIFVAMLYLPHATPGIAMIGLIACGAVWAAGNIVPDKEAKKPFVFTARVKRLFAITAALDIALLVAAKKTAGAHFIPVAVLIGYCQPLALALGNLAAGPVESALQAGFKRQARKKLAGKTVVAITGSYGKTGTKEAVAHLLETGFPIVKTPGSFNTPMGLCKVINEKMQPHHEMFITEMGATRRGDIKELCDMVRPAVGIITSIGEAHFETFGSMEKVGQTKFELADALPPDGVLFINNDYEAARKLAQGRPQKLITYGLEIPSDYMPQNIRCDRNGSTFDIKTPVGTVENVRIRLLGKLHVINVTAAFAVGRHFKIAPERLKHAASTLPQVEARLQLIENPGSYLIINDGFNSNPVGAKAAVETLGLFNGFKKILVTPGIVDMGGKHEQANFAFGLAAAKYCNTVLLINQRRTQPIADGLAKCGFSGDLQVFPSLALAREYLNTAADANSVVLFENDLPDHMEKF
ncbi:MAG: UDP-N-acetylmuramoyl-tripeptide--D-alanyl-D-alanine ligase [Nitrospinae bacterium]|nr:UDP-N-acetylmuramoyl-tripeptide--D-alanyl-D-alanine ligase [Nitrospinota bacterium]